VRGLQTIAGRATHNARFHDRLYVAAGDPSMIDVFDTTAMKKLGHVITEKGAHTFALDPAGDQVYALLPATQLAAIYTAQLVRS
jgi:hypothetical protein